MGFFSRLFRKKEKTILDELDEAFETELPEVKHSYFQMENREQRNKFISECLEQMADASGQVEQLSLEYQDVTAYLSDMEIIEDLPRKEEEELLSCVKRIAYYKEEEQKFRSNPNRMLEEEFCQMEFLADDCAQAIHKLSEAETYQEKIRHDLRKIENEKSAYQYRKIELTNSQNNIKGISMIVIIAMLVSVLLLCVLQFALHLDTLLGYLIVAIAGAVVLILSYIKHEDNEGELEKIGRTKNKLIRLQNRVKIRYVNNTNLLEYMYAKYNVSSSRELKNKYEKYQKELEERKKQARSSVELDACEETLHKILRKAKLQDPDRWLKQYDALLDEQLFKEIRHNLIIRRTKLRNQLEYNQKLAQDAQNEIQNAVGEYPQYAEEILNEVNRFEQKIRF